MKKILLDTNILIWLAKGMLPPKAGGYIEDSTNTLLFSSVSIWEVAIKYGLRHKGFDIEPSLLHKELLGAGYKELPLNGKHALLISTLPPLHKDPFDRILLAQSIYESVPILTGDKIMAKYPSSVILAT